MYWHEMRIIVRNTVIKDERKRTEHTYGREGKRKRTRGGKVNKPIRDVPDLEVMC